MRHAGLPLFIIVLCASTLFAQDQQTTKDSHAAITAPSDSVVNSSTTPNAEPWRIIPKATEATKLRTQAWDQNLSLTPGVLTPSALANPEVASAMSGTTCYYIRSYLMARDSKDSDSTHLVGVSTCQPARQYGVKTTVLQPHAVGR
jgi:hypothetical protein